MVAEEEWYKCSQDPLYYINTYGYTYDPRLIEQGISPIVPFDTYEFQDDLILDCIWHIRTGKDMIILKSRDMGVSWICALAFEFLWHFSEEPLSFLFGSRVEAYVDDANNPKALFTKIDQFHKRMPRWLLPGTRANITMERGKDPNRSHMKLINSVTGSIINGESTTSDFGIGDRRTAVFLDEFSRVDYGQAVDSGLAAVTNCRIINSTPLGMGNHFAKIWHDERRNITRRKFHWSQHPVKNKGMYRAKVIEGKTEVEYLSEPEPPKGYELIADGRLRSLWYDEEWERDTPQGVAENLDMDFAGSGGQFFSSDVISQALAVTQPPLHMGELIYETDVPYFRSHVKGRLQLWCTIDEVTGKPPHGIYGMGVDVSTGTASGSGSNSVLFIVNMYTGTQVGQFVTPSLMPMELADYAMELGEWFYGAKIIWEHTGPGTNFAEVLIRKNYRNIYEQERGTKINKTDPFRPKKPGWGATRESKRQVLGEFQRAINEGLIEVMSKDCIMEMCDYVYKDGSVIHSQSDKKVADPSGAGDNHGDRVIAGALATVLVMGVNNENRVTRDARGRKITVLNPPHGSPAWCQKHAKGRAVNVDSW